MSVIAVVTTIDDLGQAREIARELVDRKLAACVQISTIESVYEWRGSTQHEDEYRVLCKTTSERYAEVEKAILALHSYDLPAIYACDTSSVYPPYAEWVATGASGESS